MKDAKVKLLGIILDAPPGPRLISSALKSREPFPAVAMRLWKKAQRDAALLTLKVEQEAPREEMWVASRS